MSMRVISEELYNDLTSLHSQNDALVKELSEMGKAIKRLASSEKLKGELLSQIQSGIDRPLASMLELSDSFLKNVEKQPEVFIKAISTFKEVNDLDLLLKNISKVIEIESGIVKSQQESFNIILLLKDIYKNLANCYSNKIQFEIIHTGSEYIISDRDKLSLIINNLIANSIKISNDDCQIKIKTNATNYSFSITIQKYRCGIDQKTLCELLNQFKQLDISINNLNYKLLDLTVAKAMIDSMKGIIEVRSAEEFAQLTITIPISVRMEYENLPFNLSHN